MQTVVAFCIAISSMVIVMIVYIINPFSSCFVSAAFKSFVIESRTGGRAVWFLALLVHQSYSVILLIQAVSTDSGIPLLTAIFTSNGWMQHFRYGSIHHLYCAVYIILQFDFVILGLHQQKSHIKNILNCTKKLMS